MIFFTCFILALNLNSIKCESNDSMFDYIALRDDNLNLKNGNEYKFVLDTNNLNINKLLTKSIDKSVLLIQSNRTLSKRSLDDLIAHLSPFDQIEQLQKRESINIELNEEKTNTLCSYNNIKSKINECLKKSDNCKVILDCISSFNLVQLCSQQNMYTPTVWILNIYEILKTENFCAFPVECDITQNENEYLRRLDNVLKSVNEYGSAYLNQPKVDNKKYCSKSHHLVSKIRDVFDIFDMCFEITEMNKIRDLIEETADHILDRNCHYCISANMYFDNCIGERFDTFEPFNSFSCNESVKCIQDKIETYQCNKDPDLTPLKLITQFLSNLTLICDPSLHDNLTYTDSVKEWFQGIDICLKERHFMGLTFNEAPPNIDLCHEIDETFLCIRNNYKSFVEGIPFLKSHFEQFARDYNRLQRSCDVQSLSKITSTAVNLSTRHQYQNNSEQTILEDNKNYYHETIIRAELDQIINWINIDSVQFDQYQSKKDLDLSKNYLKATIVKLKFKFPYYGHLLDQIVVATGGFLYVGSLMNPLITKAQYIAPLMANFDPTLNNRSMIKYVDNTTHFICTWENLVLQDQQDNGEYTFQVVLDSSGKIMFNYKKIPNINISSSNHTVKIGLSDAYIFYRLLTTSKIEYTIVQYHVVNIPLENIKTGNSIMFFMLENCLQLKTCESCIRGVANFKCIWCPVLQRCSDTVDRYRQEWVEFSCPMNIDLQSNSTCLISNKEKLADTSAYINDYHKEPEYFKSVLLGIFITIFISMILTTLAWSLYAYKNPNSPSGIWLIEHRPQRVFNIIRNRFNKETSNLTRLENTVA